MCQNRLGSTIEFCRCLPGYGPDKVCNDLDECALSIYSNLARCSNTSGTFNCVCNSGYTGNGVSCSNIDECITAEHNCSSQATCTDIMGSFNCMCNTGYSGNGINCSNVNECEERLHNCATEGGFCLDNQGSFVCNCLAGVRRDGIRYSNID